MDPSSRLAAQLRALTRRLLSMEQVTVTGVSPLRVEGAAGDVELRALGWYDPAVGDQVVLLRSGSTAVVLGATTPNQRPAGVGVVAAYTPADTVVTVTVDGAAQVLPKAATWTPTVGETCAVLWWPSSTTSGDWSGVAVCGLGTSPTAATPPKTPTPQPPAAIPPTPTLDAAVTFTIPALSCGTWRSGAWRTDTTKVVQGDYSGRVNSGYWFYGSQLAAWRDVTVTKAEIFLHAAAGGSYGPSPVRLYTHGSPRRLATQPVAGTALGAPALADMASGWYPLSVAAAQSLVDGTQHGVAAISSATADYTTLYGLADDPMSGALRITGERTP